MIEHAAKLWLQFALDQKATAASLSSPNGLRYVHGDLNPAPRTRCSRSCGSWRGENLPRQQHRPRGAPPRCRLQQCRFRCGAQVRHRRDEHTRGSEGRNGRSHDSADSRGHAANRRRRSRSARHRPLRMGAAQAPRRLAAGKASGNHRNGPHRHGRGPARDSVRYGRGPHVAQQRHAARGVARDERHRLVPRAAQRRVTSSIDNRSRR